MDRLNRWIAVTVIGVLGVLAAGWLLLVSPKRGEAAELRQETASQLDANQALRLQLQVLTAQAKDLPRQQARLAQVAAKVPGAPALAALIRGLTAAADRSSVQLMAISPQAATGVPVPGVPAAPVAAAPVAAAPAGATPVAGAPAPVGTAPYVIPLTISVEGSYFEIQLFLSALEQTTRATRVTGLSVTPAAGRTGTGPGTASTVSGRLKADVTAEVFYRPDLAAAPGAPLTVPAVAPTTVPTVVPSVVPAPPASRVPRPVNAQPASPQPDAE